MDGSESVPPCASTSLLTGDATTASTVVAPSTVAAAAAAPTLAADDDEQDDVTELASAVHRLHVVGDDEEGGEDGGESESSTSLTNSVAAHSVSTNTLPVAPAPAPTSPVTSSPAVSPPPPTVQGALAYLDQVKQSNPPVVYGRFLDVMKDFKAGTADTPEVIRRVKALFRGQPRLLLGFNQFLPAGSRLELDAEDDAAGTLTDADPAAAAESSRMRFTQAQLPSSYTASASHPAPPSPPPAAAPYRMPQVRDALGYLEQVKSLYTDRPEVYQQFLDIMKDFKMQAIDTPTVINRVKELFQNNLSLILGFNQFLPPGYTINVEAPEPAAPVSAQPQQQQQQTHRSGQPIEFRTAVDFVAKIRSRFKENPQVYAEFLDILHSYQTRSLSVDAVEQQIEQLFKGHLDLLDEFKYFLPRPNPVAQT